MKLTNKGCGKQMWSDVSCSCGCKETRECPGKQIWVEKSCCCECPASMQEPQGKFFIN